MAVGFSTVGLADLWLNTLGGAAATPGATLYVQCHTADPGAVGTTAVATAVSGRVALTWAASSGASKAISNVPSWSATAAQTITHISVWDAATLGTFRFSAALATSKAVTNGDTLNLSSLTFALSPLAA